MAKEIKCPSCSKWNSGELTHCTTCGSILDSTAYVKEQRDKLNPPKPVKPKKPTWLDKFLERTNKSRNPFVIVARTVLYYTWMVYMGFVLAFTWLTVYTSG